MDLLCVRCYPVLTCEGPLLHADRGATGRWYQSSQAGIGYPSIRSPLPLTRNDPKGFDPSLASGMATVNQQVAQSGPTRPHPAVPT